MPVTRNLKPNVAGHHLCEYPVEASSLARELTLETLAADPGGQVLPPERPGLGMTPNPATLRKYPRPVEIRGFDGGQVRRGTDPECA